MGIWETIKEGKDCIDAINNLRHVVKEARKGGIDKGDVKAIRVACAAMVKEVLEFVEVGTDLVSEIHDKIAGLHEAA